MAHRGGYVVLANYPSSSSDSVWEVRRGGDGVLYCTCRGWVASKSRPRQCTHTKDYAGRHPGTLYELGGRAPVRAEREMARRAQISPRVVEAVEEGAVGRELEMLAAELRAARQRGVATPAAALREYAREVDGRFARVDWADEGGGRAIKVREAATDRFSFLDLAGEEG